jgi:hypothetical protein
MNKYLEKLASVPHLIKARRRVMQMIQEGTHDFKRMGFDESRVIHTGSWGTNGSGVYAGHKAPAHGYQPSGSAEPHIAFPSNPHHAIPHDKNHRFHYAKVPVQDSVIPHDIHLDNKSYVGIPGSTNKPKHVGDKLMQQDLESHIRSSKVRRIYGDHITQELAKKNLVHPHWDKGVTMHTGEEYLSHIHEKLVNNTHKIPKDDIRHAIKTMGGVGGTVRDTVHKNRFMRRILGGPDGVRQDLHNHGLSHIAETGAYRKYLD